MSGQVWEFGFARQVTTWSLKLGSVELLDVVYHGSTVRRRLSSYVYIYIYISMYVCMHAWMYVYMREECYNHEEPM